jgi:hypothetical protein
MSEQGTSMREKIGKARTIGYVIGIAVTILVVLWRLIPRFH